MVHGAHVARVTTFLDVGCGIGTKLLIARHMFSAVYGIDVVGGYVDFVNAATRLGTQAGHRFGAEVCDGREFRRYHEYDVIYMYSPMCKPELQVELELAAYRGAREGAVIVEAMKRNSDSRREPLLREVVRAYGAKIFVKTRSIRLAANVRGALAGAVTY